MTWLLRLYPREWRRRYGAEIEEIIASQRPSFQLAIDLLGGAIDAHVKPQAFARRLQEQAAGETGGSDMVGRLKCCASAGNMSRKDAFWAAAVCLVGALGVAGFLMVNSSQLTEAIVLTMFPAFLVAPSQWIFLRGHSRLAKAVLIGAPFVVCFLIGLAAGLYVSD